MNLAYKRYFRSLYLAYEPGLQANLRALHRMLKGAWRPTAPLKEYVPKASGLQRPISLLDVEDQIVLQAVANAFAEKLRPRRKRVEAKVCFSNHLQGERDSIFFLKDWRLSYRDFRSRIEALYRKGYPWIARFDLAAFYDTISHELLIKLVSPRKGNPQTWEKVKSWFRGWSAHKGEDPLQHGIPQGPIASNFLADCFLLPVDEAMLKKGVSYLRYVDDIRLFGRSKFEVQGAAITLEIICKNLGLIPQAKKFKIVEAGSLEDALGGLPSLAIQRGGRGSSGGPRAWRPSLARGDAEKFFRRALEGKPYQIRDGARARYVLYRAPKSEKLLRWVLLLIGRHPEHIDAFINFLANYETSSRIESTAQRLLQDGVPYQYVRGELWHVLARIGSQHCLENMISLAKIESKSQSGGIGAAWGALAFLLACEGAGPGRALQRFKSAPHLVQSLLVPMIPDSWYLDPVIARRLLVECPFEVGIVLGDQLIRRGRRPSDYGVRNKELPAQVQNSFRALGLIRRRAGARVDPIGEIIARRYEIPGSLKWKRLLGPEYDHALAILNTAEVAFQPARSSWLQHQDSFNDIIIRTFIGLLGAASLPGHMRTVNRKGELIGYGQLLDANKPFARRFSRLADCMREVHTRRNRVPGSHPYSCKGRGRSRFLSKPEQKRLWYVLKLAYADLLLPLSGLV